MIRYLNQEEKKKTRSLYEEAFPEDAEAFVDFYYETKMKNNLVIADVEEDGIRTMMHLNPYDVAVGERKYRLDYIVAVATGTGYRRQGLMRRVMNRLLTDLKQARCPFTFLKPANPAYYTPFDFVYVSGKRKTVLKEEKKMSVTAVPWQDACLDRAVRFENRWLKEHAGVYCLRDETYFRNLAGEIRTGGGRMEVLLDQAGQIAGIRVFDYADTKEEDARAILRDDIGENRGNPEPFMMARIVDLGQFLKSVSLKAESARPERTFRIRVKDPVLPENNGMFLWKADRETSRLEKTEEDGSPAAEFTIAELTSWLFGYAGCRKADWCGDIRTLRDIYFDEEI